MLLLYSKKAKSTFKSFKTFSTKLYYERNNRTPNPWYDIDFKITMKAIRDAPNEIIKLGKINMCKIIIKSKILNE